MARKMRKFADGGNARYDRKVKDIESDYQKALKMGKEAGVAKAKYEQRMADAKDDLAKWTKADRTQTRAAEQAAERNLSEARRTKGESVRRSDAFGAKLAEKAPDLRGNTGNIEAVKTSSEPTTKPQSFAQAFRAARNELGAGKTFTWQGKSYSTNMAGEGASKPKATQSASRSGTGSTGGNKPAATTTSGRAATATTTGAAATSAQGRGTPPATDRGTPPASGRGTPPASGRGTPPAAGRGTPPATTKDTSPWDKDAKGNWVNPEARGTRMGDVLTLGLTAAARNSSPSSGRNAYSAMSDYYNNKDKAAAAAKAKEDRDRAARIAAGRKGMEEVIRSGKKLEAPQLLKAPGAKKGGSVKGYAKGGKIDGCAVRGKTRAPMRRK